MFFIGFLKPIGCRAVIDFVAISNFINNTCIRRDDLVTARHNTTYVLSFALLDTTSYSRLGGLGSFPVSRAMLKR